MKKPAMTFLSCFDILFLTVYDEHSSIFPIQENARNWDIWPLVFVIHLLFTKPKHCECWAKVAFLLAEACIPIGRSSKLHLMPHGLLALFNGPMLHNSGSITILSHGRQCLSTDPTVSSRRVNGAYWGLYTVCDSFISIHNSQAYQMSSISDNIKTII